MWTFPNPTKSNFLLKTFNLKSLCMILMLISFISSYEWVVSSTECLLTLLICKIKSLLVFYKHVFHNVSNTSHISTLISWFDGKIILTCSMCNNLFSSWSIFCMDSFIMIAFDPKMKISPSDYHFIISLFIFLKFL